LLLLFFFKPALFLDIMPDSPKREHTHTFNGPLSESTRVSRYQKGKTNLNFTGARDSEWQWHHLGDMQVCTSLQTDNHASTPPLSFFTGRMPFLPPNQQCQSTEGEPPGITEAGCCGQLTSSVIAAEGTQTVKALFTAYELN